MAALNRTKFQKRGDKAVKSPGLEKLPTVPSSCPVALLHRHLTPPQMGEAADPEVGVLGDFPRVAAGSRAAPNIPAPSWVRSFCSKHKSTLRLLTALLLKVVSLGLIVSLGILFS